MVRVPFVEAWRRHLDARVDFVTRPADLGLVMEDQDLGIEGLAVFLDVLVTLLDEEGRLVDETPDEAVLVDLEIDLAIDGQNLHRGDVPVVLDFVDVLRVARKVRDALAIDLLGPPGIDKLRQFADEGTGVQDDGIDRGEAILESHDEGVIISLDFLALLLAELGLARVSKGRLQGRERSALTG